MNKVAYNLTEQTLVNYLFDVIYSSGTNLFLWTGNFDLVFNQITYNAMPAEILSIGEQTASEQIQDNRIPVSLIIKEPSQRAAFLQDPGVVELTLRLVYSNDGGKTWSLIPRSVRGFLSNPVLEGDRYSFEVVQSAGDIDRGRPQYWSFTDQYNRRNGDRAFEHLQRLSDGEDVRWPPI